MASVCDVVAARLRAWEVDRVFGFPGRDVDALVAALTRESPEFVQVRHEESAALMACAHAKLTGRVGCCLAPSGIGALHLLGGLYDAALDRVPVLALVGKEPAPADHGKPLRTIGSTDLLAEVSEYCDPVSDPALMGEALDRALGAAVGDRGVATLIVPRTVLEAQAPASSGAEDARAPQLRHPALRSPEKRDLVRAAEVLNAGRKVAVVVGRGAVGTCGQVVAVAELVGAAVVKTPSARDVVPDDLPYVAGVAAPRGSAAAAALLRDCDTLLLVEADDFDAASVPETGRSRAVVVGSGAAAAPDGHAEPAVIRVTGDATVTLDARPSPDRPVIALIGDGALQAGGMNELITVRRHLERLADLPPSIFCVLNNEDLSRLTWERRTAAQNPRIPVTGEVPTVPYARYARLLGLPGLCCDRPGRVGAVWEDALAARGPMLLEFMVDGDTPLDWAEPLDGRTSALASGRPREPVGRPATGLCAPGVGAHSPVGPRRAPAPVPAWMRCSP
ncbi:thiamine pyrophosphate-binding protein [Streptomyces sp. NPDC006265]|uniref:thiamine pyrophosphate-binding protein n=1 Tax=Streptomyces sp. NPDC006265 TaxID=3156740 RepID=UPI0033BD4DD5